MFNYCINRILTRITNQFIRPFVPADEEYETIEELLVLPNKLKEKYGTTLLIFDIDETLITMGESLSDEKKELIDLLANDFKIAFLSNNQNEKIESYAKEKGVRYYSKAGKPNQDIFLKVADDYGLDPEYAMMFGDSYFADMHGGRNAGMRIAYVKEHYNRKKEDIAIGETER